MPLKPGQDVGKSIKELKKANKSKPPGKKRSDKQIKAIAISVNKKLYTKGEVNYSLLLLYMRDMTVAIRAREILGYDESVKLGKMSEYRSWQHMKDRCLNSNCPKFKDYGKRGIIICPEWLDSFITFILDMGKKPDSNYTLDRVDVNKGYSKENCRWSNAITQARNTTRNHYIEYDGQIKVVAELKEITGIPASVILKRLRLGWSSDKIFITPIRKSNTTDKKYPEYDAWLTVKKKCYNSDNVDYKYYGQRGISMSEQWLESFDNFLLDMGKRPSDKHSLGRIDNNGNYCKENCRWELSEDQNNNKRNNVILMYNNKTQTLAQWSKELGLKYSTLNNRYNAGWTDEKILTYNKETK